MVATSPIVEKRKKRSVGGRRVNGLHWLSFIGSEHDWLSGASFEESMGFSISQSLMGDWWRSVLLPVAAAEHSGDNELPSIFSSKSPPLPWSSAILDLDPREMKLQPKPFSSTPGE